jgi:hypothetical protein
VRQYVVKCDVGRQRHIRIDVRIVRMGDGVKIDCLLADQKTSVTEIANAGTCCSDVFAWCAGRFGRWVQTRALSL